MNDNIPAAPNQLTNDQIWWNLGKTITAVAQAVINENKPALITITVCQPDGKIDNVNVSITKAETVVIDKSQLN